ncbi:multidrug transporter [Pacificimonas flava]|uniref:Multidrug transporter n=2 Tax=Pacificimonas TaxID=1960290 RepID=A0A219B752_9SPHN|nr:MULTISPECIES: SapC family protein [Pacificimonas]MBZ6378803.1 SapC family protein [Pacificimonas aurantium]OWV33936.1 multidrug transporter [Pacificimonas flava]
MATTPTSGAQDAAPKLPLFYKEITPLSSSAHADFGVKPRESLEFTRGVHAIPVTVDEFAAAHRFFPIVFSAAETPTPLALLGLKEGENLYLEDDGTWMKNTYVPAFIRRYPFLLARTSSESQDLSLCFDQTSGELGPEFDNKLFENGEQSQVLQNVLNFCEEYEKSISRTHAFVAELKNADLLMDGEVAIQAPGAEKPNVYRGFRMVNEQKLKDMRGDQARKLVSNGALALVYAHLMSMQIIREHFARANPALQQNPASAVEAEGKL